jgi:hypothetical protein
VIRKSFVYGGTNGAAFLSDVEERFSQGTTTTPEPGTLGMLGLGVNQCRWLCATQTEFLRIGTS